MDARTVALQQALAPVGVTLLEPTGRSRWRGRDADGGVLVTAVRPRSRVRLAAARTRADRLGAVRHRGLAEVVGCVVAGDHVAVVQRELAGTDLATVLRGRPVWEVGEVIGVVADLAEALGALHRTGLAHGDVTPANVVVGTDGGVVLVDLLGGADQDELGTPGWAAPERAVGASPAADVWSLGAIGAALLARCTEPSAALRAVLDGCTAPDPVARPSADALASAARGCGHGTPVRAVDPSLLAGAMLQEEVAREVDDERTIRRPKPVRARHRRRGPARGVVVPVLVAAVVVTGALTGVRLVQGPPGQAPAPAPGASSTRAGLPAVVPDVASAERAAHGLTLRRAAALAAGNLPALLSVVEPGSPAAAVDHAAWRASGVGTGEVAVDYARAEPAVAGEWRVAVGVRSGDVSQDVVLRLVVDDGRWLVRAVEAG